MTKTRRGLRATEAHNKNSDSSGTIDGNLRDVDEKLLRAHETELSKLSSQV